jgi:hypothetical protein
MAMLDNFVTMDKTMMCNHTPETKKQSMHCQPGPVLAKVHYSRTKLMLLVFFESKGLMYSNIVPKGSAVNRKYIVKALGLSEAVEEKEACVVEQEWWFHQVNALENMTAVVCRPQYPAA